LVCYYLGDRAEILDKAAAKEGGFWVGKKLSGGKEVEEG
jgi:hypothetical protein